MLSCLKAGRAQRSFKAEQTLSVPTHVQAHTQTLFFFVPAEDSSCCSSNAALPYAHSPYVACIRFLFLFNICVHS